MYNKKDEVELEHLIYMSRNGARHKHVSLL